MKQLILFLVLFCCSAVSAPTFAQNNITIDNPRRALGLDTLKQILPIDLRKTTDKKPGTLFAYKGRFYVAESSQVLRQQKIIPQDFKAVYEIYVLLESAVSEFQSKLPAKHQAIQNVVLIEDRKQ